jgi:hypothetical protein
METGSLRSPAARVLNGGPAWSAQETAANVALLRQGARLIAFLPKGAYAAPSRIAPGGGIGRHFRHVIDVYSCFLAGAPSGCVDYTRRERSPGIETDSQEALRAAERIVSRLVAPPTKRWKGSFRVRPEEGGSHDWIPSSIARELEFLRTHTVHHFALVAILMRSAGLEPGDAFGVAPSTLRLVKSSLQAAPRAS